MRIGAAGFTLAEGLVVLLMMALLAAIAVPAYQAWLQRADRHGVVVLLQLNASFLARHHSEKGDYRQSATEWPALPHVRYPETGESRYTLAFGTTPRNTDPDSYVLRATARDTAQGYVELLHTGILRHCLRADGKLQCLPM